MQYNNKHLLNLGVVIGVDWLKLGENRNNGVLEIPMVLLCLYNIIQRELTHVEINQCTECDLNHVGYKPTWVRSHKGILGSFFGREQFLLGEEQFSVICDRFYFYFFEQ